MPTNLLKFTKEEFFLELENIVDKKFQSKEIWSWIYQKGAKSFGDMTNLSKKLRERLSEKYVIDRPKISSDQQSVDGTRKWLLSYNDNNEAETVFIPEVKRGTLCVSSQVGCTLNCRFCHTGTQLMVRNLTFDEIVGQVMLAKDLLNDWPASADSKILSNIVLMGMGEPLLNYENVKKAIMIMIDEDGIDLSRRKITLSTSGIVPFIDKCSKDLSVGLAISLHAVNDKIRDEIVPINKKYPISELLSACKRYVDDNKSRRITFEYVMLKDVNDSDADAHELVRLIKNIPSKVNLIPFNKWPGVKYDCSSNNRINKFAQIIYDAGIPSMVRTPRGEDILAACGQLKSQTIKLRKTLP